MRSRWLLCDCNRLNHHVAWCILLRYVDERKPNQKRSSDHDFRSVAFGARSPPVVGRAPRLAIARVLAVQPIDLRLYLIPACLS
jgi:hypothetical protein